MVDKGQKGKGEGRRAMKRSRGREGQEEGEKRGEDGKKKDGEEREAEIVPRPTPSRD